MTLDQLANLTADKLEALSDKELHDILSPYFNITRPELQVRKEKKTQQTIMPYLSPNKKAALEALADEGIDMSFLKYKKR